MARPSCGGFLSWSAALCDPGLSQVSRQPSGAAQLGCNPCESFTATSFASCSPTSECIALSCYTGWLSMSRCHASRTVGLFPYTSTLACILCQSVVRCWVRGLAKGSCSADSTGICAQAVVSQALIHAALSLTDRFSMQICGKGYLSRYMMNIFHIFFVCSAS